MLNLNLFHEQQQIQREKDLDPVRLTIVFGSFIVALILFYGAYFYFGMGQLRAELASEKAAKDKLDKELKALGPLTDFPRIQGSASALQNRVENRVILATQLDILKDIIPTNCQASFFKTSRSLGIQETTIQGRKGPISVKKLTPSMEVSFEVKTRGKKIVDVLQVRDNMLESIKTEPRLVPFVHQTTDGTNKFNEVTVSSVTQDPKGSEAAIGIFTFKMPIALKDQAKDL